ncbi:DoxX family protein [Streptomyces murinus]|uniref:DoxX family protein n=1 Tax=Streptomyces murinus TaxID=33900 RepID=UPI003F463D68
MTIGLLVLRLFAGLLIAGHGIQKTTNYLGGHGLRGGIEEFKGDGFCGGALTALAAGAGQVGSGLFLAAGLLTPPAAAVAMGVMTVALTVKWRHGLWVQNDGYEYPLVLVVVAATLSATGPGDWSLDRALGLTPWPSWWAPLAVAVGVGSGLLTRLVLHRPPVSAPATPAPAAPVTPVTPERAP